MCSIPEQTKKMSDLLLAAIPYWDDICKSIQYQFVVVTEALTNVTKLTQKN